MGIRPAEHDDTPASVAGTSDRERRLVTILFADMVGSTALAELLDPEEVHDLLTMAQRGLADTVTRYQGHVVKYLGDGLMAIFGAPRAREDDAERAVLASLEMQKALEPANRIRPAHAPPLLLRVGITSGEVIAGAIAGMYDVIGDVANTAARLQSAADVGGVLVGAETMRLARRRVRFGEARRLALKGKTEPVEAFPVLGLHERLVERWETQRGPLVGRRREVEHLLDLWERASEGEGQLATLVGDAGVGKSRLLVEAIERIWDRAEVRVVRGRCFSYSQQSSLWVIADLVRDFGSITVQDDPMQAQARLDARVEGMLAGQDKGTRTAAVDVLGEVLGLPPVASAVSGASPQIRRQVLIRTLRLLLAVVGRTPAVLILEDLHWVDGGSAEVLHEVLADVPSLHLLVLAAHRPGWSAPWSEWGWPERVTLRPLGRHDAAVLAGSALGGMELSHDLEGYLAERTGGNPFFVEELLRALTEAGALVAQDGTIQLTPGAAERLPDSLTEVLLARLDRLESQVRSLAQIASVIGRHFAVRLLAHVAGREAAALEIPLAQLQHAEIAFPRMTADPEYAFKHALVQEVAYTTLLHKRRQSLHAATARALATLYPADENVDMIAYHYSRTEEHMEAAEWLERAGDDAAKKYDNQAALARYDEARGHLKAMDAPPAAVATIDEKRGSILGSLGRYEEALGALEGAVVVYRHAGDLEAVYRVVAEIGWLHGFRGTPEEAVARIEPLLGSSEESGPSHGLARLNVALQRVLWLGGRYGDSLQAGERASHLARAVGDEKLLALADINRGVSLFQMGKGDEALDVLEGVIPLAETVGDPDLLHRALLFVSVGHLAHGELAPAQAAAQRALELAQQIGATGEIVFTTGVLGLIAYHRGEWEIARDRLEQAVDLSRSMTAGAFSAYPPRWLAQLSVAEGKWAEAQGHLKDALEIAERGGVLPVPSAQTVMAEWHLMKGDEGFASDAVACLQPPLRSPNIHDHHVPYQLPQLAWAELEQGNMVAAADMVEQGIRHAQEHNADLALLNAHRVRAMVYTRQGRWEEAQSSLNDAIALAQRTGDPYAEARALYHYGEMYSHKGEPDEARPRLEGALNIFRQLGAQPYIEKTEHALANLDRV